MGYEQNLHTFEIDECLSQRKVVMLNQHWEKLILLVLGVNHIDLFYMGSSCKESTKVHFCK